MHNHQRIFIGRLNKNEGEFDKNFVQNLQIPESGKWVRGIGQINSYGETDF